MSYDARTFRILIASPSDVDEERSVVVNLIQGWNDLYSFVRKVVLLPLRWETHTAPDYGTRPQEVINRAIVDECDLLVGIFWTRIGSPTGLAESGTLEEIERVGKAGKPVMLYFSHIGIDPDRIDTSQIEKLKDFRTKSFPKGLLESYRTISEFRDKFNRQLEMKVRDLQQSENQQVSPLKLTLLSEKDAAPLGPETRIAVSTEYTDDLAVIPEEFKDRVKELLLNKFNAELTKPIVIGIENLGGVGIRNCYVQIEFEADNTGLTLSTKAPGRPGIYMVSHYMSHTYWYSENSALEKAFNQFEPGVLTKSDDKDTVWRLALEWDAVQPQRLRLVKPFFYLTAKTNGVMLIRASVFSDSFAAPYVLSGKISVEAEVKETRVEEIIPDWLEIVSEEKKKENDSRKITISR